jgi:regulator of protease activity HflC (stomatin/prohibitin superfamily)
VLSPGTLAPIHPVGFLVLTMHRVYGLPISRELAAQVGRGRPLTLEHFGLTPERLRLTRIEPQHATPTGEVMDVVGIVTTYEGDPLPMGDIASRLGGFRDMLELERQGRPDAELMQAILNTKNGLHNNYQDFQAFLDNGGKIGLQHDPLLYGAFALNPFLVSVEIVPMLVVKQGEVAVVKAYVGLPTEDTSGTEFKFGTIVKPGHRGIWQEALRTGKYPINPRCYQAEIVPTAILTLNWAEASSTAHNLDRQLKQIVAKSREGFIFTIDLQVQIHVPDTQAPRVISMVGTMQNLVNEVLQAAVGNHFRDKLQSMPAVSFIETRQMVQQDAYEHIRTKLEEYQVETKGVYIQDVILPEELVRVLKDREIANQEIETYRRQKQAEDMRIDRERSAGLADQQKALAQAEVNVSIKENNAKARKAEADGEAAYVSQTGTARGAEVRAVGMARAEAFKAQVDALGQQNTALVNAITSIAEKGAKFMPDILVLGGSSLDGATAALTEFLQARVGKPPSRTNTAAPPMPEPGA